MMIKNVNRTLILGFLMSVSLGFFSCKGDDDPVDENLLTNGVVVLNEGGFNMSNASAGFISNATGTYNGKVFEDKNSRILGDILQSMTIIDGKGYLVVNNSGKVEVVNPDDFSSLGTISGLTSPRYIVKVRPGVGYVTDLFAGGISIVDLENFQVNGFIQTGGWNEAILVANNKVYVTQSDSNLVQIIDPSVDFISGSITVSKGPNSLALDSNGDLWVLCDGGWQEELPGLYKINTTTDLIEDSLFFSSVNESPGSLKSDPSGNNLMFLNGDLFKMAITAGALPQNSFFQAGTRSLYGFGVDPTDESVWVADAVDFSGQGKVLKLDNSGNPLDTLGVGVAPRGFVFR